LNPSLSARIDKGNAITTFPFSVLMLHTNITNITTLIFFVLKKNEILIFYFITNHKSQLKK